MHKCAPVQHVYIVCSSTAAALPCTQESFIMTCSLHARICAITYLIDIMLKLLRGHEHTYTYNSICLRMVIKKVLLGSLSTIWSYIETGSIQHTQDRETKQWNKIYRVSKQPTRTCPIVPAISPCVVD